MYLCGYCPSTLATSRDRLEILCCLGQWRDGGRTQTRNSVTLPSLNIYLKQQLTPPPPPPPSGADLPAARGSVILGALPALLQLRRRPSSRSRRPRCIGCYLRQQPGIAKLALGSFSVLSQIWKRVIYLLSCGSLGEARSRVPVTAARPCPAPDDARGSWAHLPALAAVTVRGNNTR